MTIGQLAKAVNKTPRAVRLYEEMGLLVPQGRSEGGFRLYGPDAVERLRWINRLSDLGLPLNEIQSMLDEIADACTGGQAMAVLREQYRARLAELDAQIRHLERLRRAVSEGLDYLTRCRTCERTPLPSCCGGCIEEVGAVPEMVMGLLAQEPLDRTDPCRKIGVRSESSE